tara:strand:+ start:13331 stop:13645 length:315 start_codon:yes stop_codon:yes gene_type:complete
MAIFGTMNGFISEDPHYDKLPNGQSICNLVIGSKPTKKNAPINWIKVVAWDRLADQCKNLRKGSSVVVNGEIKIKPVTLPDGRVFETSEIVASNVELQRFNKKK